MVSYELLQLFRRKSHDFLFESIETLCSRVRLPGTKASDEDIGQFLNPFALRGGRSHDEGVEAAGITSKVESLSDIPSDSISAVEIRLVDDKYIADFHGSGLQSLDLVTLPGDAEDRDDVSDVGDIHFALSGSHRFQQDERLSEGVEDADHVSSCLTESTQRPA